MWKSTINYETNTQEFSRTVDGVKEVILAPVTLASGRYLITDILSASGGFGIVYKAIDKRINNRQILIKARRYDHNMGLFSYEYDDSRIDEISSIREEIEFEIHCLKSFRNSGESRMPNLNDVVNGFSPALYGPHESVDGNLFYCKEEKIYNQEPYLIMQMIKGENLGDYVNRGLDFVKKDRGYESEKQWEMTVMKYALQLCTILEHFHRRNVSKYDGYKKEFYIYQDLKPDNIIITDDVFITLLDFGGMSLVLVKENGSTVSNIKGAGNPGVGTFGYKAPEFRQGSVALSSLDEKVDIYSFGATLYHLLTCVPLSKVLKSEDDVIPVDKLLELGYTNETYELVKKCLEFNKEDRFENMDKIKTKIYEVIKAVKNFYKKSEKGV